MSAVIVGKEMDTLRSPKGVWQYCHFSLHLLKHSRKPKLIFSSDGQLFSQQLAEANFKAILTWIFQCPNYKMRLNEVLIVL